MVAIMREVRRVLRDDGVCWFNYGDCYAGSGGENANTGLDGGDTIGASSPDGTRSGLWRRNPRREKLPVGNLMLMPHRIAIALQDDGWVVRQDVIWEKPNPMPESVAGWRWERERKERHRIKGGGAQNTNMASMDAGISGGLDKVEWEYGDEYRLRRSSWRHTTAHEHVFMLTKGMGYYCNQEAVRERAAYPDGANAPDKIASPYGQGFAAQRSNGSSSGRNPRSVMRVATASYSGSHYACYPPDLIAPLIRASCPRRSCPECGAPWAPVVERPKIPEALRNRADDTKMSFKATQVGGGQALQDWRNENPGGVTDYRPTCEHNHEPVPGIVLDPFLGSGTTGMVAKQLMRRWIGLDISMPYLDEQAKVRTGTGTPSGALDELPLFELPAGDRS